jgi:hypothetical protein
MTSHQGRLEQLNWTVEPPAPRRRRWPTRLAILFLVLAGLFTAADRVAVSLVQDKIAARLQSSQNLPTKPSVTIAGFPFLTQLVGMRLDKVTLAARGVVRNGVRVTDLRADLRGVKPSNGFKEATADSLNGTAFFNWADLQAAAATYHVNVTLAEGEDQTVRVSGNLRGSYAGITVDQPVTVVSKLTVEPGNKISVRAVKVETKLPQQIGALIPKDFDFQIPIGSLPMGMTLHEFLVGPDGVRVSASAQNVTLTGNGVSAT